MRFLSGPDLRADIGVAAPLSYRAADNSSRSARLVFSLSNSFRLCPEKGAGALPVARPPFGTHRNVKSGIKRRSAKSQPTEWGRGALNPSKQSAAASADDPGKIAVVSIA